ncbi:hypothetical protein [Aureimonas leprariae]|uniref:Uncharacterized protein n=1 Tax=Plantimonas leprariae TaxID=2615207 RepID=A0A7V7PNA2_9HYPH|nr:hypothetical protein [Aureimonas leprariae]KAB0679030.1 hypothetical protein F6X38_14120 [Aureimonas leprariae]
MIRGSIEFASSEIIEGWIFTEDGRVRDRTVLAFQNETCVGAGKVGAFRADLADAGMGDGYLGFSFPISVPAPAVGSIVVKLEGSDAILLQRDAAVVHGAAVVRGLGRAEVRQRLAALKWALKHGRIAQSDFDYLRILCSFGVYERGLVKRNGAEEAAVAEPAAAVAAHLLEVYLEMEASVATQRVRGAADFRSELARIAGRQDGGAPVVAVHSNARAVLRVVEGSHVADAGEEGAGRVAGLVDYPLSATNLVMLDARARCEIVLPEGGSVEIVSANPALN